MAPNSACTTALPRLGRMTCSTASVPTNTHSHQVLPRHPRRGFVGADHAAGHHRLADRRRRSQQRLTRTGQHVADRAFTDREREQSRPSARPAAPVRWHGRSADKPPMPQSTGRTASLAPARAATRRSHARRSTRSAAKQAYPRHVRPDRRQLDAVVHLLRRLLLGGEGGGAMRAGVKPCIERRGRGSAPARGRRRGGSCAADDCAPAGDPASGPSTAAATNCPGSSAAGQLVEPRLQIRDACACAASMLRRRKLRDQRQDQRILLGVAQLAQVWGRYHPAFRIDSTETVSRIIWVGRSHRLPSTRSHAALGYPG